MTSSQKPPTVSDDQRAKTIYRRAAAVINKKGFGATSMGDIADAVDLTKGGLYYYIKGKEALLFAIMNYAMELLERDVMKPAAKESDPERRLACLVSGNIRLVLDDPSAMSILISEDENLDTAHRAKIIARKHSYSQMLSACIEAIARRQSPVPNIDPTVAAYSLLGMIHSVVRWYQADSRLSEPELVEQLTHLALYGIMPLPAMAEAKIA